MGNGPDDISATHILNYQYVPGSPPPPAPFFSCAEDPTFDGLECESYAMCP